MRDLWTTEEEASRLKQRFAEAKAQGIGQAQFARDHSVPGGPSMVNQHISGNRPISMEAAGAYAKGFGCSLADISPRLAAEISKHSQRQPVAAIPYSGPSNMARELALVFDQIPESEVLKRSKAYSIATDAIAAVLQGERVTLVRE